MEPVQIDFIYGGNTETEGAKIEQSMDNIASASKKAQAQAKEAVKEQLSVVKQIEADIKAIESQISKAAPGNAKSALIDELNGAKRALSEEKAALNDVQTSIENTAQQHVKLRTRVMEAKQALSEMEMAGKRGTPEYAAQAKVLGELNDQFKDTATQAAILADDEKGFKGVASAVSGVAGAMSAGVGAAALFGAENEDLARIQTRLQAVMAITIGIQQVAETLNKDSYFSVVILTKAKELWAATELRLATSIGISTAAARASMIMLTGGVIIAVIALVAVIDHLITKQQESAKAAKEFGDKTAEAFVKPLVEIKRLSDEWKNLGNNMDAKQAFIEKNKEAFKSLGIEINNVAEAENLLSSPAHLKAFEDAMMAKAKASAAMEIATEKYKEAFKKQAEVNSMPDMITSSNSSGAVGGPSAINSGKMKNTAKSDAMVDVFKKFAEGDAFFKIVDQQNKIAADKLKQSNVTVIGTIVKGSVEAIEAAIAIKKEALKKVTNKDDYDKIDAEIKALQKKEDAITGGKPTKPKIAKEIYDAGKEITDLILDINAKRTKLELEQQADSLQKRLASIEAEKTAEIRKIEDKEADIVKAYNKSHKGEKGFVPKTSVSQIDSEKGAELTTEKESVTASYSAASVAETKKYGEEVTKLISDFADARIKIELDYTAKAKELTKEADSLEAASKLNENEKIKQVLLDRAALLRDNAAVITDDGKQRVSEASKRMIEETSLYKTATGEQLMISKELTEKLIGELKKRIEADKSILPADRAKMLAELNKAEFTVQKTDNPFIDLLDGLEKYKKAREEQSKKNTQDDIEGFAILESAANKAQRATLEAASGALQGIGSVLSEVVSTLDSLGILSEKDKKTASQVINMVSGAATMAQGLATGNPIAIITGSIQLLTNAFQLFDVESKKIADRIAEDQAALENLTNAYEKLKDLANKSYGSKKSGILLEEIENRKNSIKEYQDLINAEYDKRTKRDSYLNRGIIGYAIYLASPDADEKKIKEWQDKIKALEKEITDLNPAVIEALTGSSISSAIDEFANAYADAFTSGDNAAENSANLVKNIFKKALTEGLKNLLNDDIQKLMSMVAAAMVDGILTDAEKASILAQKKIIDDKANNSDFNRALSELGLNDNTTAKGIQGDVKNMTEETGSALTGQIVAMRLNVAAMLVNSKNSVDIMSKQLAVLESIRTNTQRLDRIDETLYYMKINGIKVL